MLHDWFKQQTRKFLTLQMVLFSGNQCSESLGDLPKTTPGKQDSSPAFLGFRAHAHPLHNSAVSSCQGLCWYCRWIRYQVSKGPLYKFGTTSRNQVSWITTNSVVDTTTRVQGKEQLLSGVIGWLLGGRGIDGGSWRLDLSWQRWKEEASPLQQPPGEIKNLQQRWDRSWNFLGYLWQQWEGKRWEKLTSLRSWKALKEFRFDLSVGATGKF